MATGATTAVATTTTEPVANSGISPELAQAATQAASTGQPVEVTDMTTETSKVVALPEGGFKLTGNREPVRTQQDDQWVPVDDTLQANGDGTLSPAAATVDLKFSGGGTGPLLTMGTEEGTISLTWPTALPPPQVDGDTATYPDVLPGVDLTLIAGPAGYKQLITVKSAEAAANPALESLDLTAHADGLKLTTDEHGAITVTNDAGEQVMAGPRPYQWDASSPGPETATADNTGASDVTLVDVESGTADGTSAPATTQLTISPDTAALQAADTTFPVRIDPSLSKIDAHYLTVQNTGWNYYDDTSEPMRVGHCYNGLGQCANNNQLARSFFSFDVSLLTSQVTTAKVFSASVIATQVHNASCSATPVTLWSASAFTSSTVWNGTESAALQTVSSSGGACGSGSPADVAFNNAAVVTRFQTAANTDTKTLYFGLLSPDETNQNYWKKFGINPSISVVYDFPPNAPTALDVTPKVACGGVNYANNSKPTFTAKASNNNPGYTTVDLVFEVHTNPSSGTPVVSSGQLNVLENTAKAWTTPTALAPGSYALRVQSQTASPQNADLTAMSPWFYFKVEAAVPSNPTISSTSYPQGQWGAPANAPGTFTLGSGTTAVGFSYGIDTTPNSVADTTCVYTATSSSTTGYVKATNGTATFTPTSTLGAGYHTLNVRAFTGSHTPSAVTTSYGFYVKPPTTAGTFNDLQSSFNNNGVTGAGLAGDIGLTASNSSIDAAVLTSTVAVGGTTFTRPVELANGNDNTIAGGQQILVQPQLAKAVHLLVASTCGATPASFSNSLTMTFDSLADPYDVTLPATPDWLAAPTGANALALPNSYKEGSIAKPGQPVLYNLTADVDVQTQKLTSITLPTLRTSLTPTTSCTQATLHVLAVTIDAP